MAAHVAYTPLSSRGTRSFHDHARPGSSRNAALENRFHNTHGAAVADTAQWPVPGCRSCKAPGRMAPSRLLPIDVDCGNLRQHLRQHSQVPRLPALRGDGATVNGAALSPFDASTHTIRAGAGGPTTAVAEAALPGARCPAGLHRYLLPQRRTSILLGTLERSSSARLRQRRVSVALKDFTPPSSVSGQRLIHGQQFGKPNHTAGGTPLAADSRRTHVHTASRKLQSDPTSASIHVWGRHHNWNFRVN